MVPSVARRRLDIELQRSQLVARVGYDLTVLEPENILAAALEGSPILGFEAPNVHWPQGLEIQSFPARPRIVLTPVGDRVRARLQFATRFGDRFEVQAVPEAAQVVYSGTWYPILRHEFLALIETLADANGPVPEVFDLAAFLRIARHEIARGFLESEFQSGSNLVASLLPEDVEAAETHLAPPTKLRPYQRIGERWLSQLGLTGVGGILGDEMGLGKTIQILALLARRQAKRELFALLIVPSSLTENWKRELLRFTPQISWIVHRGRLRTASRREFDPYDVVITTYDVLVSDVSLLAHCKWRQIVCDEAHMLRNASTMRFRAIEHVRRLNGSAQFIGVTGTPIQNSLRDVWALLHLAAPGYFGSEADFLLTYEDTERGALALEQKLSPLLLRRRISEVGTELPPLVLIPEPLEMTTWEALRYEELRREALTRPEGGLSAITHLRMYCCNPRILETDEHPTVVELMETPKVRRLIEILSNTIGTSDKTLVFTSFNRMAEMLLDLARSKLGVWAQVINGDVNHEERQRRIDNFSEVEGPAILVLNPQAGGVGLNIQAASRVIHYNLEWNPAVEEQATGRAYRIGQVKPVTVHRLFYVGTIEEAIDARVEMKRELITHAVKGIKGEDVGDLAVALAMTPLSMPAGDAYERVR
jgi:SNF2 family DNA or RNA helicase